MLTGNMYARPGASLDRFLGCKERAFRGSVFHNDTNERADDKGGSGDTGAHLLGPGQGVLRGADARDLCEQHRGIAADDESPAGQHLRIQRTGEPVLERAFQGEEGAALPGAGWQACAWAVLCDMILTNASVCWHADALADGIVPALRGGGEDGGRGGDAQCGAARVGPVDARAGGGVCHADWDGGGHGVPLDGGGAGAGAAGHDAAGGGWDARHGRQRAGTRAWLCV